ncbi:MAG: DUF2203 domain-containing protein [Nanoarchaeota archaeon]
MKKYFTLDQAKDSLKDIKKLIQELKNLKDSLDLFNSINIEYSDDYNGNFDELNFTKINKDFHKMSYDFFCKIEEIEKTGCLLKDINEGLIDFYCLYEGREILLCWKEGEEDIEYWHEIEDGFRGRKPINLLVKEKNKQI